MNKHTPGPWQTGRTDMQSYDGLTGEPFSSVYRVADDPRTGTTADGKGGTTAIPLVIARVPGTHIEREEEKANAALIAAAPDLLAACEAVYAAFGLQRTLPLGFPPELEATLRAAIAKARSAPARA